MHASPQSGPIQFAVNHWPMPAVEPTTLIAYWPSDAPPKRDQIIHLLQSRGAAVASEIAPPSEPQIRWHVGVRSAESPHPIHLWCEANDHQTRLGDRALDACPWIIGMQTVLEGDDPAGSFDSLIQLLFHAAPAASTVFDANTALCHTRVNVEQMAMHDAPPPTDWLWRVDVIAAPTPQTNLTSHDSPVWLRTVGLNRCALPELEIVNIPRELIDPAVTLLNVLADHFIDQSPPAPGSAFEIGPDLSLSLLPVAEFLRDAGPNGFGSLQQRRSLGIDDDAPSAVVVDAEANATLSSNPPIEILQQIADGAAPLFLSTRATARQAALARRQWPRAVQMYQAARRDAPGSRNRFFVKAAIEFATAAASAREHLWFEVLAIEGDKARARPLHHSAATTSISIDDEFTIDATGITDWRIETAEGAVGPIDLLHADAQAGRKMEPPTKMDTQ